jgi:XTP/dITP diphosphohydrolase
LRKIHFATSNQGKFVEVKKALESINIEVEQLGLEYPEVQSSRLEDVARFGIGWLMKNIDDEVEEVVLEDAGLFIHTLRDFPGVYSAHVFKTIGIKGILKLMLGESDRSAHFESCIAFCEKGSEPIFFFGNSEGTISSEPRGEGGFGYDPIFVPDGEEKAFAEMTTQEKNQFSHRGKALEGLVEYLKSTSNL